MGNRREVHGPAISGRAHHALELTHKSSGSGMGSVFKPLSEVGLRGKADQFLDTGRKARHAPSITVMPGILIATRKLCLSQDWWVMELSKVESAR